jgi:hypothetical protein
VPALTKEEATMGKLLNQAAFLEFGEHLQEGSPVTFSYLERAGEILKGNRVILKL